MLEFRYVWQQAGSEPLFSGVDLVVPRAAPTSLVGLSPIARGMLMRLLTGRKRPEKGSIRLYGQHIGASRRIRGGALRVGPEGYPRRAQALGKVVSREFAARVGLENHIATPVSVLDHEQRIRLAMAAAMESEPALLLLDAPAIGLAPEARTRLASELGSMAGGCEAVVLLAAGGADEALGLGGATIVFSRGVVCQSGSHREVISRPASLVSARAVAWPALNCLPLMIENSRVGLADGGLLHLPADISLPSSGRYMLAFHPDVSTLTRDGPDGIRFIARAMGQHFDAGRIYDKIEFGGSVWLTPRQTAQPARGALLNLFVPPSSLWFFDAEGNPLHPLSPHNSAASSACDRSGP